MVAVFPVPELSEMDLVTTWMNIYDHGAILMKKYIRFFLLNYKPVYIYLDKHFCFLYNNYL